MSSLDVLGTKYGTDKGAIGQGYLDHYERNFRALKDCPITLLEIGIAQGSSLAMWQEYLPQATIVGVDINEACLRFANGSIHVEIGSQADAAFLKSVAEKYKPNIVIDDGSHLAVHNMISFSVLFPLLAPGGLYIIEDLYLHYSNPAAYQAGAQELPSDYFARLAVKLTAEDAGRVAGSGPEADTLKQISRIEFIRRGIIIEKTGKPDPAAMLAEAWPLVEHANNAYLWHTLGAFILKNGLALHQAESATRHAIALAPRSHGYYVRLSDVLERQGRLNEALDAARKARDLAPGDESVSQIVGRLDKRCAAGGG